MPAEKTQADLLLLMRKSLIVQLGLLGLNQKTVRAIVGCDMNVVSDVMKHLDLDKIKKEKVGQ